MIMYLAANGVPFSKLWWTIILAVIAGALVPILDIKGVAPIPSKLLKVAYTLYILSVSLHGFLGLFGLIYLHDLKSVLLFVGCALYMISDFFLWQSKFNPWSKDHKWVHNCNSISYFIGMLLVAFSASVPMPV